MRLITKVIRILRAKFHCNRLTTVQDIQDYASLNFLAHSVCVCRLVVFAMLCLHKRGLCYHAVSVCMSICLFVHLSVTYLYSVKTNKHIF